MIERVIENWLDRASERSFEAAFCYMLIVEGYTILHMTRHSPIEMGKDVIAIAPDGVPCAFQLKSAEGGELTLTQYRNHVEKQIPSLVEFRPEHPSLPPFTFHRAYLVTNGTLAEETIAAIRLQDESYVQRGMDNRLLTIVKGELFTKALAISDTLIPRELTQFRDFFTLVLEIYLTDGKEPLQKEKLCELLVSVLNSSPTGKLLSKPEVLRRLSAAALLVAILTNEYSKNENYFAEFEAWCVYIALCIQFGSDHGVANNELGVEIEIAKDSIFDSGRLLIEEASAKTNLSEGDPLMDPLVMPFRITWLLGVFSTIHLLGYNDNLSIVESILDMYGKRHVGFWGETALPYYVPVFWFLEHSNSAKAKTLLIDLIKVLCVRNSPFGIQPVPNPYYSASDIMKWIANAEEEPKDHFASKSFALFPLLSLAIRRNFKAELKELWPYISQILVRQASVKGNDRFSFRSEITIDQTFPLPMEGKWEELIEWSLITVENQLPSIVIEDPVLLLLTCLVFPHRMTRCVVNFWMQNLAQSN